MDLQVYKVEKREYLDYWTIIKFQLWVYCHTSKVDITNELLNTLTSFITYKEEVLNNVVDKYVEENKYTSTQSARNALNILCEKGLIVKTGKSNKKVTLSPEINIESKGNILLDYKFLYKPSETN